MRALRAIRSRARRPTVAERRRDSQKCTCISGRRIAVGRPGAGAAGPLTSARVTPLEHLRAAVAEASAALRGDGAAAGAPSRPSSAPDARASATTRPTPRCCWRRVSASRRARSPSSSASSCRSGWGRRSSATRSPAPASSTCSSPTAGSTARCATCSTPATRFGAGGVTDPERILVEFVSANPTGPVVAASGRHAAYGDALASILAFHGHEVAREYYLNDAGSQVRKLGESVRARARGEEVPEGGYEGEYVKELAVEIAGAADGDPDELATIAVGLMYERIKATLERYGVDYDRFFSEKSLYDGSPSEVDRAFARLEELGHTYRHEGALWLRTTTFGDDKDRVLQRSNGEPTYFASDVAYLLSKQERGFTRQLDVFGADHHGYIGRLKAAMEALGGDPELLEILIMRFVNFVEAGEREKMSKRRGVFTTLDELLDELGVDATRFFMLQRSHDTTLDLDLDLARKQSNENPVYYVQYAARADRASMLERAGGDAVADALAGELARRRGALAAAGSRPSGRC